MLYWFYPTPGRLLTLYHKPVDDMYTDVVLMSNTPVYLLELGAKHVGRVSRWSLVLVDGRMLWVSEGILNNLDKVE